MEALNGLFDQPLRVIVVGVETFSDDLRDQDVPVVHMSWRAPTEEEQSNKALASRLAAMLGR